MSNMFNNIELSLSKLLQPSFNNVYCSPKYKNLGNESVRIQLLNSTLVENNVNFEIRDYEVEIRLYQNTLNEQNYIKKNIRNKHQALYNILAKADTYNEDWLLVNINNVEFDIEDAENLDNDNLNIVKYVINLEVIEYLKSETVTNVPEAPENLSGDANADGAVNVSDAVELVQFFLSETDHSLENWFNYVNNLDSKPDANEDGNLNVADIQTIINQILN